MAKFKDQNRDLARERESVREAELAYERASAPKPKN